MRFLRKPLVLDKDIDFSASKALLAHLPKAQLLWASVREVININQADECGCDIVTVPMTFSTKR